MSELGESSVVMKVLQSPPSNKFAIGGRTSVDRSLLLTFLCFLVEIEPSIAEDKVGS